MLERGREAPSPGLSLPGFQNRAKPLKAVPHPPEYSAQTCSYGPRSWDSKAAVHFEAVTQPSQAADVLGAALPGNPRKASLPITPTEGERPMPRLAGTYGAAVREAVTDPSRGASLKEAATFHVTNSRFWEAALLPMAVIMVVALAACTDLWLGRFVSFSTWYLSNFYALAHSVQVLHPHLVPLKGPPGLPFSSSFSLWLWSAGIALVELMLSERLGPTSQWPSAVANTLYGACVGVWALWMMHPTVFVASAANGKGRLIQLVLCTLRGFGGGRRGRARKWKSGSWFPVKLGLEVSPKRSQSKGTDNTPKSAESRYSTSIGQIALVIGFFAAVLPWQRCFLDFEGHFPPVPTPPTPRLSEITGQVLHSTAMPSSAGGGRVLGVAATSGDATSSSFLASPRQAPSAYKPVFVTSIKTHKYTMIEGIASSQPSGPAGLLPPTLPLASSSFQTFSFQASSDHLPPNPLQNSYSARTAAGRAGRGLSASGAEDELTEKSADEGSDDDPEQGTMGSTDHSRGHETQTPEAARSPPTATSAKLETVGPPDQRLANAQGARRNSPDDQVGAIQGASSYSESESEMSSESNGDVDSEAIAEGIGKSASPSPAARATSPNSEDSAAEAAAGSAASEPSAEESEVEPPAAAAEERQPVAEDGPVTQVGTQIEAESVQTKTPDDIAAAAAAAAAYQLSGSARDGPMEKAYTQPGSGDGTKTSRFIQAVRTYNMKAFDRRSQRGPKNFPTTTLLSTRGAAKRPGESPTAAAAAAKQSSGHYWDLLLLCSALVSIPAVLADRRKPFEFSIPYLLFYNLACVRVPDLLGHSVIETLSNLHSHASPALVTTGISFTYMISMQVYTLVLGAVCSRMSSTSMFPRFYFVVQIYYYLFWYMMLMVMTPGGIEDKSFWVMVCLLNGNCLLSNIGIFTQLYTAVRYRTAFSEPPLKTLFDAKLAAQDQLADVVSLLIVPATATSFHICSALSVNRFDTGAVFNLWQRFGALLLARLVTGVLTEEIFRRRLDVLHRADNLELQLLPLDHSPNRARYLNDICVGPKLALESIKNIERCELYFCAVAVSCAYSVFQHDEAPVRYAFVGFGT